MLESLARRVGAGFKEAVRLAIAFALVLSVGVACGSASAGHAPSRSAVCGVRSGGEAPVWLSNRTIAYIGPGRRQVIRHQTLTDRSGLDRLVVAHLGGARKCSIVGRARGGDGLIEVRKAGAGRLVYASDNFQLFSLNRATHAVSEIGSELGSTAAGQPPVFAVSANERKVAFTANCACSALEGRGTKVAIVSALGGPVQLLSGKSANDDSDPSFSPNGKNVVLRRGLLGRLFVHPAHAGGRSTPLGVAGDAPTWSPDGRLIAFIADPSGRLDVIDTRTHKVHTLVDSTVGSFSWSPSSKRLIFTTASKIGTVSLSRKVRLFTIPHGLLPGSPPPQWSPDGQRIAFTLYVYKPRLGQPRDRIYTIHANGSRLQRVA